MSEKLFDYGDKCPKCEKGKLFVIHGIMGFHELEKVFCENCDFNKAQWK